MNPRPDGTRNQPDAHRDALARQIGAPAFKAGDPVPGLSSWVLERKLGGGGFGAVWLARHALNKYAPRAVKFCTDPDARHRLVTHEKNVVARVMRHAGEHPNIVPLLEYNLDGAVPWLMYEYVEGGTLAALAEEWHALPLPKRLGRAVKVLHQIAGALAAMHKLNPPIVHRDLKPANVLMAGAVPRITDFGIGGVALPATDRDGGAHTAGAAKLPTDLLSSGTQVYSSPEQRLGAPPGPRDDVYSLGVIAYQLVTADPYSQPGSDALQVLREKHVPDELAGLIVRSAATDPDRRPRDAGEWEATLGALIGRSRAEPVANSATVPAVVVPVSAPPGLIPTTAHPASSTPTRTTSGAETARAEEPPRKSSTDAPKRRGGLIAALLLVGAALAVGLFVALRTPKSNDEATRPTEQQADVPAPQPKANGPEPKAVPAGKFPANSKPGDECDIEIAPNTKMRFCYVRAGECQLGSPQTERAAVTHLTENETEGKRGTFATKGFWMGKYEVTQAEWAAVMRGPAFEAPSEFRPGGAKEKALGAINDTSRFPVENVSWTDCQEFLKRANAHRVSLGDKGALDLPHEDEWEYACRGGLGNQRPFHFGEALNGAQANCNGESPFGTAANGDNLKRPQPAGSYEGKAPHPWGLCDMHGNVSEFCKNQLDNSVTSRVVRGGGWHLSAHYCRAANRDSFLSTTRYNHNGFRAICTNP